MTETTEQRLTRALHKANVERDEARQRIAELEAVAKAVLYHDERGQGVGYSEAMEMLRGVLEGE